MKAGQMVENPLSKKDWVSVGIVGVLSSIMVGFLNALEADLYQVSKKMVFDTPAQYALLALAIVIGIGIIIGVVIIILDIYKQRKNELALDRIFKTID